MVGDTLHAAWFAVSSNRVRTTLTAGSVAVGVCSVVFMASLARSGLRSLGTELEAMGGAQLVGVFPKKAEGPLARYATGLTMDDVNALRGRTAHTRWISSQTMLGRKQVAFQGREASADVVAGDSQVMSMLGARLAAGRPFVAT